MRTTERRNAIIELLCERRYEKIENLAFEFSVNESTMRRDIQELSLSYPLYTKTGINGGVYVEEGYYFRKQYLKAEEKAFLEMLGTRLKSEEKEKLMAILKRFSRPERR